MSGVEGVGSFHAKLGTKTTLDAFSVAFTLGYVAGTKSKLIKKNGTQAPLLDELCVKEQPDVLFLDMDDTLYRNNFQVAEVISQNIRNFCSDVMGLEKSAGYGLYQKYGTTLRGMLIEKMDLDVEDYMTKVHDIRSVAHLIVPDERMNDMLGRAKCPLWIFTASTMDHTRFVLNRLQASHFFGNRVIACTSKEMGYGSKYEEDTYHLARLAAGASGMGSNAGIDGTGKQGPLQPHHCYFADDSSKNIERAKKCGWHTCLIGHVDRYGNSNDGFEYADHVVHSIHELENIWPHLFRASS